MAASCLSRPTGRPSAIQLSVASTVVWMAYVPQLRIVNITVASRAWHEPLEESVDLQS